MISVLESRGQSALKKSPSGLADLGETPGNGLPAFICPFLEDLD
jgi:hypothetical protein